MKKNLEPELCDDNTAAYRFLQEHGVHSFEELEQFKKDFPECKYWLITKIFSRLVYEKHGVRVLDF